MGRIIGGLWNQKTENCRKSHDVVVREWADHDGVLEESRLA